MEATIVFKRHKVEVRRRVTDLTSEHIREMINCKVRDERKVDCRLQRIRDNNVEVLMRHPLFGHYIFYSIPLSEIERIVEKKEVAEGKLVKPTVIWKEEAQ